MLDAGVSADRITFSSDSQGSLPIFDDNGTMIGMDTGKMNSLYDEVADAVKEENIPLDIALRTITSNNADLFCLPHKGRIREENDADLVLVDEKSLEIQTVMSQGSIMMKMELLNVIRPHFLEQKMSVGK